MNGGPSEGCAAEAKLKSVLNTTFHFTQFLAGQLEALLAIAHKKDVFVHMRTGGGKSLCMYGVPLAIGGEAMGVIISPLVGLMEQQVSLYYAASSGMFSSAQFQICELGEVGVAAVHMHDCACHVSDVKAGKFRFGQFN